MDWFGEFTVNIVSESVVEAMSGPQGRSTPMTTSSPIAGLTAVDGKRMLPLVAESLANFECKVRQIIEIGASGRTQLVIGDVLVIHVEDQVLDGTRIDHDALGAVGRMAGNTYIRTRDRFEVGRPI